MFRTDLIRRLKVRHDLLSRALESKSISLGFQVVDGYWSGDLNPVADQPEDIRCFGGDWDGVGRKYLSLSTTPDIVLPVVLQQAKVLQDTDRFICCFGAQRSGKSIIGLYYAMKEMIDNPGCKVMYIVPAHQKADIIVEPLVTLLGRWLVKRDRQRNIFVLENGSQLRIWSAAPGHEESIFGFEADIAVLEEAREYSSAMFRNAFSRITSRNGRMLIVTSPEVGHVISDIATGAFDNVNFSIHNLSAFENKFAFRDPERPTKMLELAKRLYDPQRYKRDVLGLFVAEAGRDYYNLDDRHCIDKVFGTTVTRLLLKSDLLLSKSRDYKGKGSLIPDPRYGHLAFDRIVGMDAGTNPATAVEAVLVVETNAPHISPDEVDWSSAKLLVLRCFQKWNTSVPDFVATVLRPAGLTPDKAMIICDPSGGLKREHVSGKSTVQALQRLGYFVEYEPQLRAPGIRAVNLQLHLDKLFFLPGASKLVEHLRKVKTLGKTKQAVSRDKYGHYPDALRYLVNFLFPEIDLYKDEGRITTVLKSYSR